MIYVNPDEAVHPLRLEMGDDHIVDVIQGIADNKDWMTIEDLEAAQDYLYDTIAAKIQTHEGVTTLQ